MNFNRSNSKSFMLRHSPSLPSLGHVLKGMQRAAEDLMDKLNIGHSALRSMRAALLAGDEEKALEEYGSVDKSGKALMQEMPPSLLFTVPRRHVETTVLHLAAEQAMRRLVVLLLDHGADPNARTSRNESAVHSVCLGTSGDYKDRVACLKALLDWSGQVVDGVRDRASVNCVDADGCTPVHHVARRGYVEMAKMLIARGANITIVNAEQETASDVAAAQGHTALANWLEAHIIFGDEWGPLEPLLGGQGVDAGSGSGSSGSLQVLQQAPLLSSLSSTFGVSAAGEQEGAEVKEPASSDLEPTPHDSRPLSASHPHGPSPSSPFAPPSTPLSTSLVSLNEQQLRALRDGVVVKVMEALQEVQGAGDAVCVTSKKQQMERSQRRGGGGGGGGSGGGGGGGSVGGGPLSALAEALLHVYKWDEALLLSSLRADAAGVLEDAKYAPYVEWLGIPAYATSLSSSSSSSSATRTQRASQSSSSPSYTTTATTQRGSTKKAPCTGVGVVEQGSMYRPSPSSGGGMAVADKQGATRICPICRDEQSVEAMVAVPGPCGHSFCPDCLRDYLTHEIAEKGADLLKCAEFSCCSLIPLALASDTLSHVTVDGAHAHTRVGAHSEEEKGSCVGKESEVRGAAEVVGDSDLITKPSAGAAPTATTHTTTTTNSTHAASQAVDAVTTSSTSSKQDLMSRYEAARLRAFVERADYLSNCPAPACSWVVMRPKQRQAQRGAHTHGGTHTRGHGDAYAHTHAHPQDHQTLQEGVEWRCLDGHSFCPRCHSEPHAPCRCAAWRAWQQIVAAETLKAQEDVKRKAILGAGGQMGAEKEAELLANALWISANTKECPKCGTPIEKTSGCNHITCTQRSCRHEWCWICGSPWSLHSNQTGGFFRCNRFLEGDASMSGASDVSTPADAAAAGATNSTSEGAAGGGGGGGGGGGSGDYADEYRGIDGLSDVDAEVLEALGIRARTAEQRARADQMKRGSAVEEAKRMAEQSRRMARFIHHYTRFRAHEDSIKLEKAQQEEIMARVHSYLVAYGPSGLAFRDGVGFVQQAFNELYVSRQLLRTSYAYAFFELAGPRDLQGLFNGDPKTVTVRCGKSPMSRRLLQAKKHVFELHQSELEMLVESLSGTVDPPRRRLHASKAEIVAQTAAVHQKRTELEDVIGRGILPEGDEEEDLCSLLGGESPYRHGLRGRPSRPSRRHHHHYGLHHHPPPQQQGGLPGGGGGSTSPGVPRHLVRHARLLEQLADELQGLGLNQRELTMLAGMEDRDSRPPTRVRPMGAKGENGAYAQLQKDVMSRLESVGLSDVDMEVAMLDRAIRESLMPPPSQRPPDPSVTPTVERAPDGVRGGGGAGDGGGSASSVDSSSGSGSGEVAHEMWECRMCTLVNEPGRTECEVCGSARGSR